MATSYKSIIDLALVVIRDYKLDKLFEASPTDFDIYMSGYLVKGLNRFRYCAKNLALRDDDDMEFEETLDDNEKSILADCVILEWLESEILDTMQITGMMMNKKEAQRYSEANLLREKLNLKVITNENLDRKIVAYVFDHTDFNRWVGGDYGL
jgi:hypothetical protein